MHSKFSRINCTNEWLTTRATGGENHKIHKEKHFIRQKLLFRSQIGWFCVNKWGCVYYLIVFFSFRFGHSHSHKAYRTMQQHIEHRQISISGWHEIRWIQHYRITMQIHRRAFSLIQTRIMIKAIQYVIESLAITIITRWWIIQRHMDEFNLIFFFVEFRMNFTRCYVKYIPLAVAIWINLLRK